MNNYSLALVRLKLLNRIITDNPKLRDVFINGEYDLLQSYQESMLFDLVAFYNEGDSSQDTPASKNATQTFFSIRFSQAVAFLISVCSCIFLCLNRKKVIVYTADRDTDRKNICDFRSSNLFNYLSENRVAFFEVFHSIFDKKLIQRFIKRKRAGLYIETIDGIYEILVRIGLIKVSRVYVPIPDFVATNLSEGEVVIFNNLLRKYIKMINRSYFRIKVLSSFLRLTNVKVFVGPSDTRNYNELVAACCLNDIKTYAFQSGNISKYNVGSLLRDNQSGRLIKPDLMIVESGYWRKELIRLGSYFNEEEIIVGGNIKADNRFANEKIVKKDFNNQDLVILVPYEIAAPKSEVLSYLKKILSYKKVRVVFKFRADRLLSTQVKEYGIDVSIENFDVITDLKEIKNFDVVVGTYSTFLYEMIGRLKPVAVLESSLDYGEGLVINKLVERVSLEENLYLKLRQIAETDTSILLERKEKLYGGAVSLKETLDKILVGQI